MVEMHGSDNSGTGAFLLAGTHGFIKSGYIAGTQKTKNKKPATIARNGFICKRLKRQPKILVAMQGLTFRHTYILHIIKYLDKPASHCG